MNNTLYMNFGLVIYIYSPQWSSTRDSAGTAPGLFTIYIDDIFLVVKNSRIKIFADESKYDLTASSKVIMTPLQPLGISHCTQNKNSMLEWAGSTSIYKKAMLHTEVDILSHTWALASALQLETDQCYQRYQR